MNSKTVLERLEKACADRDIKLVYDDLQTEGGLCRLRDRYYVIINRRSSTATRIRMLQSALARVPVQIAEPAATEPVAWPAAASAQPAAVRHPLPGAD